jgi:tripartite-type tricarboxylate transporter receptor subunit TctC
MPRFPLHARRTLLLSGLVAAAGGPAMAQAPSCPSKPVKWIVGYPAGGGADYLARTIAAQMSGQMGQQVIIETRAGARALIGAEAAAHSGEPVELSH